MMRGLALALALFTAGLPAFATVPPKNVTIQQSPDGNRHSKYPNGDAPSGALPLAWSGLAGALATAGITNGVVGTPFSFNVCPYLTGGERLTATLSIVDATGDDPASEGWTLESNCTGDSIALLQHPGLQAGSGTFQLRASQTTTDDSSDRSWLYDATEPGDSGYQFPTGPTPTASSYELTATPTFHNIGLYWKEPANNTTNEALCRYRQHGTATWYQCPTLWWDARTQGTGAQQLPWGYEEARGSILQNGTQLGVSPNTVYDVEVLTETTRKLATAQVTTWTETFNCASTVTLSASSSAQLTITSGGTPGNYVCYQPSGYTYGGTRAVIDVNHAADYCVRLNAGADYVIIRGLECRDADEYGIGWEVGATGFIIEDNDISGYGHAGGTPLFACNGTGGMGPVSSSVNTTATKIVIQNNYIHDPAYDANNWEESRTTGDGCGPQGDPNHAAGSNAMYFKDMGGQIVIRYNRVDSDLTHMHDDLIGGAQNFSHNGGLRQDFDIYENDFSYSWDDCIEADGANANGRIYNNRIQQCYVMLSNSANSVGPLYVFRNVVNLTQKSPELGGGGNGWWNKIRSKPNGATAAQVTIGGGLHYSFHNTLYRPNSSLGVYNVYQLDEGATQNMRSYNNIFQSNNAISSTYLSWLEANADHENNLYSSGHAKPSNDSSGDSANPVYAVGHASGPFTQDTSSPAYDTGTVLPGLNDRYFNAAPDRGAIERGQTAIT